MFKLGAPIALLVGFAAAARAEPDEVIGNEVIQVHGESPPIRMSSTAGESLTTRSNRTVSQGWLILPEGYELGGELRFITSRAGLAGMPLQFTDAALATARVRTLLGRRAELSASIEVLPKQPSYTDEMLWQGASVAVTAQPWSKPLALWTRVHGGPMIGRVGYWGQLALGADARKVVHEIMTFEGKVSTLGTYLLPDAGVGRAWVAEAAIAGSLIVHDPMGWTGGWFGFDYSLPLAHAGTDPMSGLRLDPQPRLDVSVGVTLSFIDHWDVFGKVVFVDRGDSTMSATQLPILDGGFDQRQLIVGLTYHPRTRSR